MTTELCLWIATSFVVLYVGAIISFHVLRVRKLKADFLAELEGKSTELSPEAKSMAATARKAEERRREKATRQLSEETPYPAEQLLTPSGHN